MLAGLYATSFFEASLPFLQVFEILKALEPSFSMIPSQGDISQVDPPATYSSKMVQCVLFILSAVCFLNSTSAAKLVSTRVLAALQTIALALKQKFGVNVHVIVRRTVSLHLCRVPPFEAF